MLTFKKPDIDDMELYFRWANEPLVRTQSFNSEPIALEEHKKWFYKALEDETCFMYLFQNEFNEKVGQVRIQKQSGTHALISISIDANYRGMGYAKEMILMATKSFIKENADTTINAYIKEDNVSSRLSFENAGFKFEEMRDYNGFRSFYYTKNGI